MKKCVLYTIRPNFPVHTFDINDTYLIASDINQSHYIPFDKVCSCNLHDHRVANTCQARIYQMHTQKYFLKKTGIFKKLTQEKKKIKTRGSSS